MKPLNEQKADIFRMMGKLDPNFKKPLNETMSDIPADANDVEEETSDEEILRAAIISELDAINLYEQMASKANSEELKKLLLDISKEEKTHFGEFQALLLTIDEEQVKELEAGEKETEDVTKKEVKEGNAFAGAAHKAKEEGKDTFEINGKTYNVK